MGTPGESWRLVQRISAPAFSAVPSPPLPPEVDPVERFRQRVGQGSGLQLWRSAGGRASPGGRESLRESLQAPAPGSSRDPLILEPGAGLPARGAGPGRGVAAQGVGPAGCRRGGGVAEPAWPTSARSFSAGGGRAWRGEA